MQLYYTRKLSSPESSAVTDLETLTEKVIVFRFSNAFRKYVVIYTNNRNETIARTGVRITEINNNK